MSKRVLVTGAAGGIGEALCLYFKDRGYTVLSHARHQEQAEKLAERNGRIAVWGDLTMPDEVEDLANQVRKAGALDLLVHNAGVLSTSTRRGPAGLGIQAEVNVVAPLRLTQELADHLTDTGTEPAVVVISSTAANLARSNDYAQLANPNGSSLFGHYAMSKSAANALVLAMAEKWSELPVYSTEPGFVKTAMTAGNSSMPAPMRFMANFVAATPEKAAHRCFDYLLDENPPTGAVIQSGKVIDSSKKKWGTPDARANLEDLLAKAKLSV